MKTHFRGEDGMAGVGFKSGPLLPMIGRRELLRQALRRRQHFDAIHAEFGERIDNGVADRSERRRSAALAP